MTAPSQQPRPSQRPRDLLAASRRLAVVGCSATPGKDAHDVPRILLERGWDVLPVNPSAAEIFGRPAYKKLADVPGPIDLVVVFRPSNEAPDVARQAVAAGAKGVWLQLGLRSEEARRICEEVGLAYVENRCTRVEADALPR